MAETFYVTTPIYYVNDVPHIGHAYTTIAADVLARYWRLRGRDTFFLTGTDEHADKVARAARERGVTPVQLADEMAERFKSLWKALSISNDDFLRTTEPRHESQVEEVFRRFSEAGDLYLGDYEGWYCTPCESYWLQSALVAGKCPECNRAVEHLKEPAYFFRLSKYQDRLQEHIEANEDFVRPRARRNEVLGRLREGLKDVCVSRTGLGWGIPLPMDTKFTIYVWIDALLNYITGVEYVDGGRRWRYWPADVQLVGKDILWFHAVVWPCMLFSLDVPLPKCVMAHGWWTSEGTKMSKSRGNFVDPWKYCNEFGADAFRYFLLRQVPFGQDADFSHSAFIERLNGELANNFGNLISRTISMIQKYRQGRVPPHSEADAVDRELIDFAGSVGPRVAHFFKTIEFSKAIQVIMDLVTEGNRYVEKTKPFALAHDDAHAGRLDAVLANLYEVSRLASVYLWPFIPTKATEALDLLGQPEPTHGSLPEIGQWRDRDAGVTVRKATSLFPRVEAGE